MSEERQRKPPKSVTVQAPAKALPAPPDPTEAPPQEDMLRKKMLQNLDLAIVRMSKELLYFTQEFDEAWVKIDDFDEIENLKEVGAAGKELSLAMETYIEAAKITPKEKPQPASTRSIVTKPE